MIVRRDVHSLVLHALRQQRGIILGSGKVKRSAVQESKRDIGTVTAFSIPSLESGRSGGSPQARRQVSGG